MNEYYDALTIYKRSVAEFLHGNLIIFKKIFLKEALTQECLSGIFLSLMMKPTAE